MNVKSFSILAAVSLAAMATVFPAVGATQHFPEELCEKTTSEGNVLAVGAAEAHVNWQPDCVRVFSGGKVFWSMVDLAHTPISNGCFDGFRLSNGAQTKSATFEYIADHEGEGPAVKVVAPRGDGTLAQTKFCMVGAGAQEREGPLVAISGSSGPKLPTVVDVGDAVEIHYICDIHKAKMHARIVVEKTAA